MLRRDFLKMAVVGGSASILEAQTFSSLGLRERAVAAGLDNTQPRSLRADEYEFAPSMRIESETPLSEGHVEVVLKEGIIAWYLEESQKLYDEVYSILYPAAGAVGALTAVKILKGDGGGGEKLLAGAGGSAVGDIYFNGKYHLLA